MPGNRNRMEICNYWISLTRPCTSMQGDDLGKAIHWLVIAERCDLQQLTSRITSFIADSNGELSTFPGSQQLSSTVFLQLLHLRHATANQMKASMAVLKKEKEDMQMEVVQCYQQEVKLKDDIEGRLSRGLTSARFMVKVQMRQCQRHMVCRKCKNREDPCQACGNIIENLLRVFS
jgi:hypothetical protein